jgi:uncharacterized protein YoxC
MLDSSDSWEGAHSNSEHELTNWLRNRTIDPESGVADVIRACWSAWLGSRSTSLTELHVLVARRERSKAPASFSAGVAALLLVIGIVGTLSSVKPILKEFQFRSSTPEGVVPADDAPSLVNVEDSTALVNSLMHSLGDSFLPSLVALAFTILVVALRGIYSTGLHRYTLELDRFAMGTVMPHYQPRSISDEYKEVRTTFGSLAKRMEGRDDKFDNVIAQLKKFVDSVGPTLEGLDTSIVKMATAADALATKSNSIATTLTRTLGKKSPLYAAVNGFEDIFATTNERLDQLSKHIDGIRSEQQEDRAVMLGTLEEASGVIKQVSGDHQLDREKVSENIAGVKVVIEKMPANMLESAQKIFDDGMITMRTTIKGALDKQSDEAATVNHHTRSKTQETLDLIFQSLNATTTRINDSVKMIPEVVERLNESLNLKSETEKAAVEAIGSLAQEAKAVIRSAYEDVSQERLVPPTPVSHTIISSNTEQPSTPPLNSFQNRDGETPPQPASLSSIEDDNGWGRAFLGGFFGGRKP